MKVVFGFLNVGLFGLCFDSACSVPFEAKEATFRVTRAELPTDFPDNTELMGKNPHLIACKSLGHEDFDALPCYFAGPTTTASAPDPTFPLDRLRAHDGPVVYATLGTVFNRDLDYFRAIITAFADNDALVVVTTGRAESLPQLGELPGNVIARSFVPQTDVLREADLCFTHGGFGSTTDTVLAGVPAVFTPMGADQFFNAHRMEELGAGRVLGKADVTPSGVRRVADALLSGARPAGLATLKESFEQAPGPAGAVREIERVLA